MERYHILEQLGHGTYGTVFKVLDQVTNQVIVLKQVKMDDEIRRQGVCYAALREISILQTLKHPNIVAAHGMFHDNGNIYMRLEALYGDLTRYRSNYRMDASRTKGWMRQLLQGLDYCHARNMVHRDLKPENLLLSEDGSVLKIADFGMARRLTIPIRPMTAEVCSRWYRAPEILLGERRYTTAVDMWSMGCIFVELLYDSKVLFEGTSNTDQLDRIFRTLGTPTADTWPGFMLLPNVGEIRWTVYPARAWSDLFPNMDRHALDLVSRILVCDPAKRLTAKQALAHSYFTS